MTAISQLLIDAYRQSNLISINATLTSAQETEALRYLNRIISSVYGQEAGESLSQIPIGGSNIYRPEGWPYYNLTDTSNWFVPKNSQLMCNIPEDFLLDADSAILLDDEGLPLSAGSAIVVYLDPQPDDGTRFGVTDVAGTFNSASVIVSGNGRRIENHTFVTLDTDYLNQTWFYRQDLANWYKVDNLLIDDTFPFPSEFEDLFITMLALRLNPSYATDLDPQSTAVLNRSRSQFRARYSQHIQVGSELGLVRMPNSTADRYYWIQGGYWGSPTALFNSGLAFPFGWGY